MFVLVIDSAVPITSATIRECCNDCMNAGITGLDGCWVPLPFIKDDLRVIRKSDLARFMMFLQELGKKAAMNGISPYR
jgi:hypothetical protein